MRPNAICLLLVLIGSLPLSAAGPARTRVDNWTVRRGANGAISGNATFVAVQPCRLVDTRTAVGPFGGPSFAAGETRHYVIPNAGSPSPCGVPLGSAYSLNFSVVNFTTRGNLRAYPTGSPQPNVSTLNFGVLGFPVANGATIAADGTGSIDVFTTGATDVIIDVNGYFVEPVVTAVHAGTGLAVTGSGDLTIGLDTTGASANQVLTFDGSTTTWTLPPQGTITGVSPGIGLTGGATSGVATLNVDFAGSGVANTAARSDHKHYASTVIVSPVGTATDNGTALLNAMAGITPSGTSPMLLKIEPGTYDLGSATLQMKAFADVEGSGEDVTVITSTNGVVSNLVTGTVTGAGNSEIRFVTIENATAQPIGSALLLNGGAMSVKHVTLNGSASSLRGLRCIGSSSMVVDGLTMGLSVTGNGIAVDALTACSMTMSNSTISITSSGGIPQAIRADGGFVGRGITATATAQGASSPAVGFAQDSGTGNVVLTDTTMTATAGGSAEAIVMSVPSGKATFKNVTATATGGINTMGAFLIASTGELDVAIESCHIESPSAGSFGVFVESSTATALTAARIDSSYVRGGETLHNGGAGANTVTIANSRMEGGPTFGTGITCAFVIDEAHATFTSTCPP